MAGFFRGTGADSDFRFKNRHAQQLKAVAAPPIFSHPIDPAIPRPWLTPWVSAKITELLGVEDEILVNMVTGHVLSPSPCPKELQVMVTGQLAAKAAGFAEELWTLLVRTPRPAPPPPPPLPPPTAALLALQQHQHFMQQQQQQQQQQQLAQQQAGGGGAAGPLLPSLVVPALLAAEAPAPEAAASHLAPPPPPRPPTPAPAPAPAPAPGYLSSRGAGGACGGGQRRRCSPACARAQRGGRRGVGWS